MKNYKEINWYIIIRRNLLLLIVKIIKSLFFISILLVIYWLSNKFYDSLSSIEWLKYFSFIVVFSLLNYAFLNLISSIIEYYNDLIILHNNQIIILKSSLILKDDMEILDTENIIKIDWYKRWLLQNLLWYWDIIVEQQKNDVRVFHFIWKPHAVLQLFKAQKEKYRQVNKI